MVESEIICWLEQALTDFSETETIFEGQCDADFETWCHLLFPDINCYKYCRK